MRREQAAAAAFLVVVATLPLGISIGLLLLIEALT